MKKKPETVHFKLVRDGIPEVIKLNGEEPVFRRLDDYKKIHYLKVKLIEEAKEVLDASPENRLKELADVVEVIDELLRMSGSKKGELQKLQREKRKKVGGFRNGIFLEKTRRL